MYLFHHHHHHYIYFFNPSLQPGQYREIFPGRLSAVVAAFMLQAKGIRDALGEWQRIPLRIRLSESPNVALAGR